jgi:hypothetical protein
VKSDIAVALIGAIGVGGTIVGTFAGTVLGARIQARGGHDQAQAARDAAATAAGAARQQALHERQWAALSTYLGIASACSDLCVDSFVSASDLPPEAELTFRDLHRSHAEAELALPSTMNNLLVSLANAVLDMWHAANKRALVVRAARVLAAIEPSEHGGPEAERARLALEQLRASDPLDWGPLESATRPRVYAEAFAALNVVPQLDAEGVSALVTDAADPTDSGEQLYQLRRNYQQSRQSLIRAARQYWGTDVIA